MLLLPLHRPITRANFPWLTALLVLANVFVFAFLQSGDRAAEQRAADYYQRVGLGQREAPAFERWLVRDEARRWRQRLEQAPEAIRPLLRARLMQQEAHFRAGLEDGTLFENADVQAQWQPYGREFARLQDQVFTHRHALDAAAPNASDLFAAMFMHAGLEHLIGNMLFLIALGLLVEGPLGPMLFAALYLLGGIGAGLAWLFEHGHQPGTMIGASGAIASLMGAFCVLWGRRRVRFFWWFFVVFDYVRAPALVLLPLWLGWELLQLALVDGAQVAYAAHAGGIVTGALLALAVRRVGWQRDDWLDAHDDDRSPSEDIDALHAQALQLLGRMQLAEAQQPLDRALRAAPERADLQLTRLRIARYANAPDEADAALRALLQRPVPAPLRGDVLRALVDSSDTALAARPPASLVAFVAQLTGDDADAALALLDRLPVDAIGAGRWLQLAFRLRDAGRDVAMRTALERLVERHPQAPEADKARFLLSEGG